jgi:ATP-dependent DNA helicase DinG
VRLAPRAWIFTSATLGDDDALTWFTESPAALEDAAPARGQPLRLPANARLWVPPRFPKPNEAGHPAAVGALAARCAAALGGRTFVLTTTLRALPVMAEALQGRGRRRGRQPGHAGAGHATKRACCSVPGDGHGKVLVGSQSFWEGIDVPGDALQCVLIDKLPFPPPNDPLVEARVKQLQAQGRDPSTTTSWPKPRCR